MGNRITIEAILDAAGVKRGSDQAEASIGHLGGVVKGFAGLLGGIAVGTFLKGSFNEFAGAEREMMKLGTSVRNAGGNWELLEGQIARTTNQMQFMVGYSDDELQAALRRMVVSTGDVEGSLQNLGLAADVAASFDRDLVSAAAAVGAAMEGNYRKLVQMLPELKDLAKEGITAAEALKLLRDRTSGAAEGSMGGAAGAMKQLKLAVDELKESVGSLMNSGGMTDFIRALSSIARGDFVGPGPDAKEQRKWESFWRNQHPSWNLQGVLGGEQKSWWDAQAAQGPPAPGKAYFQFPGSNLGMGASSAWKGWDAGRWAEHWASFPDRPEIAKRPGMALSFDNNVSNPGNDTYMLDAFKSQEAQVKAQLTSIFQSAITAGIHGSAKDIGKVFFDAVANALAQKAAGNIADKLFGAAKGMAGPLGWLFG